MIFSRIIAFLFLLFISNEIVAQNATIEATVDKNKVLIGEPFQLTIKTTFHPTAPVSFIQIDSIPHFEVLEKPLLDSHSYNDELIYEMTFRITSFDSGHWVIPSFVLSPGVATDTIPVDVVYTEDFDSNQDYHDIKDIIEVKPKKKIPWWWFAAGGALLLLGALAYFLRRKKPNAVNVVTPVSPLNAYEEAMKELDELQRSKSEAKTFYSKLTGIFRLYVYRRKGILSLQKTTDDLVLQLKGLDLSKEQFDKLAQAMRLSDFVKFAKYAPTEEDDVICFTTISESIKTIERSGA